MGDFRHHTEVQRHQGGVSQAVVELVCLGLLAQRGVFGCNTNMTSLRRGHQPVQCRRARRFTPGGPPSTASSTPAQPSRVACTLCGPDQPVFGCTHENTNKTVKKYRKRESECFQKVALSPLFNSLTLASSCESAMFYS